MLQKRRDEEVWMITSWCRVTEESYGEFQIDWSGYENKIIIDIIIKEPIGGAHHNPQKVYDNILTEINQQLPLLLNMNPEKRIKERINKFSKMGIYSG